jgi:hypothetical protein
MAIAKRRMAFSAALGLVVAAGLQFVQTSLPDSPKMNVVREVASVMMMPATLITMMTRQVHSKSVVAILVLDFLFYALCFYGLLTVIFGRKQKS